MPNLSEIFRVLLAQLALEQLGARIEQMDAVIRQEARENEACQRLTGIPGVGGERLGSVCSWDCDSRTGFPTGHSLPRMPT